MSFEKLTTEGGLDKRAREDLDELMEMSPNSPIVVYLKTLSIPELHILDQALNSDGASFFSLNIYEGEEAVEVAKILRTIVAEPIEQERNKLIKKLP
jgi:hypothetical protein